MAQLPPRHIRRGVSVARALRGFGSVFRTRPDGLGDSDKAALYERSEQAEHIDAFISHSWGSPGLQKYLSLVLAEGVVWAVLANLCFCVATAAFQSFVRELPGNTHTELGFQPLFCSAAFRALGQRPRCWAPTAAEATAFFDAADTQHEWRP